MTLGVAHQVLWCCWFLEKSLSARLEPLRVERSCVLCLWKCHASAAALQDRYRLWDNRPDGGNV